MMPLYGEGATSLIEIGCGCFGNAHIRLHLVENILWSIGYRLVVVQLAKDAHRTKIRQLRYVASVCGRVVNDCRRLGNAFRKACIRNLPCLRR